MVWQGLIDTEGEGRWGVTDILSSIAKPLLRPLFVIKLFPVPHLYVILAPVSSLIIGSFISHAREVWGCDQIRYIGSLHAR